MEKYCSKCGSLLIDDRCPVCGHKEVSKKPKKSQMIWFIALAVILGLSILANSPMRDSMEYFLLDRFYYSSLDVVTTIDDNHYDNVQYALPATGDDVDITLCAGNYVVGEDIPEGVYKIVNKKGFGAIWIDDMKNDIYINESLNPESEGTDEYFSCYLDNVRLYNGANINVYTNAMQFISSNGQTDTMGKRMENPFTTSYTIDGKTQSATLIGDEIPAGTYDIIAVSGSGLVESENWTNGIHATLTVDENERYDVVRYNNVVLNEDEKLDVDEGLTIELVPSATMIEGE